MQMVTVKLLSISFVSDGGESSTESASDCSELSLVGQQNNSDERAAASTDTFDVPDPGFLPRDLHADSDKNPIVDWDALSTTDDAESDSRRNPFIDDEAIEEADRVDDEANDDEDGYDDVDDCGGGSGGDGDDDDNGGGGGDGDGDDEQAEENDLKLSFSEIEAEEVNNNSAGFRLSTRMYLNKLCQSKTIIGT